MTQYMLRTLCVEEAVDAAVLVWIRKAAGDRGYVVIKHNADKEDAVPHWHAWFTSDKKEQALRVDFKKNNEKHVGNGSYSLKVCKNTDEYLRYMCHANGDGCEVDVIASYGVQFTPQWFVEQNRMFYQKQREFKKKYSKASVHTSLYEVCKERGISTREGIVDVLMDLAEDYESINVYRYRDVVNAVWLKLGGKTAREMIKDAILQRI